MQREKVVEELQPSRVSESRHLLIVESDFRMRDLLQKVLTEVGYQVVAVPDGGAALKQLGSARFDLIITDFARPLARRIELLKRVKREHCSMPVICLIPLGADVDDQQLERIGVKKILMRPVRLSDIEGAVRNLIG